MADTSPAQAFPRRDAAGRVISLREFLAASGFGAILGVIALVVVDGILSLVGLGSFGDASGWLAVILPALLFFDDLRAWRGYGARFLVGLVGAAVAIGLGLIAAAIARELPSLVSGAVGALVASLVYCAIWFTGIRWLTGHHSEKGSA